MAHPEQRSSPRVAVAVEVHLGRRVGNDVVVRTRELSTGGARVVSRRPLRVDEELRFDLDLPGAGEHLTGTARVVRQHLPDVYALRFEQVSPASRRLLHAFMAVHGAEAVHNSPS
jgi:hypothetical protein